MHYFVSGALDSGLCSTYENKLFAAINVPLINWKKFTRHERKVGLVVEHVAKDSCKKAVLCRGK